MTMWTRIVLFIALMASTACESTLEDGIARLRSDDPMVRETAMRHLLLAKDRAVGPLVAALDDTSVATGRPELADVLVSLMVRVDDPRIVDALEHHMIADPDVGVRQRIAYKMGLQSKAAFATIFMRAVEDTAAAVRQQAMRALARIENQLKAEQKEELLQLAKGLVQDPDQEVRIEAMFVLESHVGRLVDAARQQALKAELAAADSIFARALSYAPKSKNVNYFLALFYYENDQQQRGIDLWRHHGQLLDVPQLSRPPTIDGQLDEAVWQEAARVDSFYHYGFHTASFRTRTHTQAYVGYTRDALYIGMHCQDAQPENLIVASPKHDNRSSLQDLVEFFIDPSGTLQSHYFINVNSVGAVNDAWTSSGASDGNRDYEWNADADVSTHVGADFWSVEYKFTLGQARAPRPTPGTLWAFNLQRGFRRGEWSQWVRTYSNLNFFPMGYLFFQ
jgi:HEAT repeat protein